LARLALALSIFTADVARVTVGTEARTIKGPTIEMKTRQAEVPAVKVDQPADRKTSADN